jgi:hypothetical protein
MYLHPITKDEVIPQSEYFQILSSKSYELYLKELNKPLYDGIQKTH